MTVNLSMLMYSMLSVQIVYSVQLNCTDSNYRERERDSYIECATVQRIECTDSVRSEPSLTDLYLQ